MIAGQARFSSIHNSFKMVLDNVFQQELLGQLNKKCKMFMNDKKIMRFFIFLSFCFLLLADKAFAYDLILKELIEEALKNNHEIIVARARVNTSEYRIPQVKSLPDPTIMFGYQNEGWKKYTYGNMEDSQWMFSVSQMFPYPGKLELRGKMAVSESETTKASLEDTKLKVIANLKEFYYDLFFSYKSIDIIRDKTVLFSKIEDAAHAHYASGMTQAQEVVMAQAEKYILLEREETEKQKIQTIEAMLNSILSRDVKSPLGKPVEPVSTPFDYSLDEIIKVAYEKSPELRVKAKMIELSEVKVEMARKEYYPDFTVGASFFKRSGIFEDMWSITTAINIPLYYKTKQQQGVNEAASALDEAGHQMMGVKTMISESISSNYYIIKTADKLMDLYKRAIVPKIRQDFELAMSGYIAGKTDATTVIARLKALLEYEFPYWKQFVEREKAIAKIEALTGVAYSNP